MFKLNCFGGKSIKKVNNWEKIELRKKDILFQYGFDIFALFFSFICIYIYIYIFFPLWHCGPMRAMTSSFLRFLGHTQRRTTVDRMFSGRMISSSQRPLPDNTQHSQQTNIHAPDGIRNHNISRRAAAVLPLKPRGHWNLLLNIRSFYSLVHSQ